MSDRSRADGGRGTTAERGYGAAWTRLSKRYRQAHPLCEHCKARGVLTPAALVDHIVPTHVAPERILDESNLQSLCTVNGCHARKTREDIARYGSHAAPRRDARP